MARQFLETSAAVGIDLEIVEDAHRRQSAYTRSYRIPAGAEAEGTLVARMKYLRSNLDYVFQHKRATERALRLYQHETADYRFLLPEAGLDSVPRDFRPDDPYPTAVYKFPERDHGKGLAFLKVGSVEEARSLAREVTRLTRPRDLVSRLYSIFDDHEGTYQRYVRGPLLGDRLYIVRAHVLVTPVGVAFLSAHRVVSGVGVPARLPAGVVRDVRPYTVNYSAGAKYTLVPAEEEIRVREAAIAIGEGLSWAASRSFGFGNQA